MAITLQNLTHLGTIRRPLQMGSISDTASAILAEYSNNGAGNGSDLGDASSIATTMKVLAIRSEPR